MFQTRSRCACLAAFSALPAILRSSGASFADVELRERSLAAQHVHADLFQLVRILRRFDPLERGRLQLLDLFFDHYWFDSWGVRIQHVHHGLMAFGQRQIQRVLLVIGARLHIRAARNEQPHHFHVPILRRGVQRRPSAFLARVHVRAVLQQRPHRVLVSSRGRRVKRRVLHRLRAAARTSAPRAIRASATPGWPKKQARCSGVQPSWL